MVYGNFMVYGKLKPIRNKTTKLRILILFLVQNLA